ncbi:hypothetical protein OG331_11460 [Streptomyces sp. NBC_01017]|uniref:hypothetical protein n=1 Tax=Streptomyces sp. NBC_01017 TaxID=2903721 RepID=UPI00386B1C30|nr:hypothetical protein OG331_11460 [Streptomyces sp. NBC_01017]
MRDRTAVVVSPSRDDRYNRCHRFNRYDVILVSLSVRCPLRGRHWMSVTNT